MNEWLDGFIITHYTFALETDPVYAADKKVKANGLKGEYRENFLFGPSGVLKQGTGQTESGEYITIDWSRGGPKGRDTWFVKGIGGKWANPSAWESIAVDPAHIQKGKRVKIEIYPNRTFLASDTGGKIRGKHIDVFVGAVTLSVANGYGRKTSRIQIL
jgi:3D (Asp-Asp-Asp) domain-containing protein